MTRIEARIIGGKALLARKDLEKLVDLARRIEGIDFRLVEDDFPTQAIIRLAEEGGAFDFLKEKGEEVYTAEDGELV